MAGRTEVERRGGAIKYRGPRSSVSAIPATLIKLNTFKEKANGDLQRASRLRWEKWMEEV